MSGPRDDFVDGLTYQVKAEVVGNYLRERRILEEEIKEYRSVLAEYRTVSLTVREARDHLICLLVTPDNFERFFRLLGFEKPPLMRLGRGEAADGPPSCPVGLNPKGFTRKARYESAVIQTYALLYVRAEAGREAADGLLKLAREVNDDIDRFHRNHDVMSIVAFLRSMDPEMLTRKKFMGENFTAQEVGELEKSMTFKKLSPAADDVRPWPELPPPARVKNLAGGFIKEVFREGREEILPAIE